MAGMLKYSLYGQETGAPLLLKTAKHTTYSYLPGLYCPDRTNRAGTPVVCFARINHIAAPRKVSRKQAELPAFFVLHCFYPPVPAVCCDPVFYTRLPVVEA